MAENFDPIRYGVLWQKVQDYERRFLEMEKKMDKMENQLDELISLANQGKGGFWVGMTIASSVGALLSWVFSHMKN
jgi:hypothetical protein